VTTKVDAVDEILNQWRRERPDLDPSPMGPIGRIARCEALIRQKLDKTFSSYGMTSWEFDVLASLRRAGKPYRLSPTDLYSSLMVTSGTMTNRLQRLENIGLIARIKNDQDARSIMVQLTEQGLSLIDKAVEAHITNERAILSGLSSESLARLNQQLIELLSALERED
jgi:DNA-binding MarR family transcriptional regulator